MCAQLNRISRRESPTPSPSPPPSLHLPAANHRPSALDALRHLAGPSAAAEVPARVASPFAAPSPGISPANTLGFAVPLVAAQPGPQHAAFPAAASPAMPPRFAEKQFPPEFLAGGASEEPSPSPPAHLAAPAMQRQRPGNEGHIMQQSLLAKPGALPSIEHGAAAGVESGSGLDGLAATTDPSDAAARTAAQEAQVYVGSFANAPAAPEGAGLAEPSQQQQQPEYEIAPEHQFRIVSSDDESSDSDNSNSGTGY